MKKRLLGFVLFIVFCLTACSGGKDGNEEPEVTTDMDISDETGSVDESDSVNLMILPENCEFIPFEQFKEGFAAVCNVSWEAPMPTYEEVAAGFGADGVYYPNCDLAEDGFSYKTYAWFSDEDWGDSKISVAIVFKAPEGTDEYTYWAYGAQGITAMDLE